MHKQHLQLNTAHSHTAAAVAHMYRLSCCSIDQWHTLPSSGSRNQLAGIAYMFKQHQAPHTCAHYYCALRVHSLKQQSAAHTASLRANAHMFAVAVTCCFTDQWHTLPSIVVEVAQNRNCWDSVHVQATAPHTATQTHAHSHRPTNQHMVLLLRRTNSRVLYI